MSLSIRLLGARRVERDDEPGPGPRGNKAWALLEYLVLSPQPSSRRKLAELLFSEAEDPLGALRWSLAQLRQALRQPNALRGDPVDLALEPGTEIDLRRLRSVRLPEVDEIGALTGELLEGMTFATSPAFEAWLAVERRHLAATAHALLLERAQAELGAGDPGTAVAAPAPLLELNPFKQTHHELARRTLLSEGATSTALPLGESV